MSELARERQRRWRANNSDKLKAYSVRKRKYDKERYPKVQAQAIARSRAWYSNNRERAAKRTRTYYQRNKARIIKATALWRSKNPKLRAQYNRDYIRRNLAHHRVVMNEAKRRRKAKLRGAYSGCQIVSRVIRLWKQEPFFVCYYCQVQFPTSILTVEHIVPISKHGKHAIENVARACPSCNSRKRDKSIAEINANLNQKLLSL